MNYKKLLPALNAIFLVFILNTAKAQTEGDNFFGMPQVHSVYMTFTPTNYWDSLVAYMPIEQYMKANITIDGIAFSDVGIKFKGNSSYTNPSDKKPFKIDMNEFVSGQNIDGLKKFNLNNGFKDPSFMREKIALDFYNQQGLAAPRCAYSRVYINGVYWGLYTFVEEVDKTFLDQPVRFENKQGNLFKGDPSGDLKWINNSTSSYYNKYELHTNTTANDWTDLVNLIDNINNSGTNFHDSLEAVFNTNSFVKHWAAMNLFSNLDSYLGSGHNYFLYHDTVTNKFEWITWDVNESFGNFNMGMTLTQMKNLSMFFISSPTTSRPLVQNMLLDPVYKSDLVNTFCQWISYDFSNAALDSKIDSLANAIRADVYSDTKKFYSNANFDANLSNDITIAGPPPNGGTVMGIKSFITARRNAIIGELATNGCSVGISEKNIQELFKIYPNPASDLLTIETNGQDIISKVKIVNLLGQEMLFKSIEGSREAIDISFLPSGMYILNINNQIFRHLEILH